MTLLVAGTNFLLSSQHISALAVLFVDVEFRSGHSKPPIVSYLNQST